MSSWLKGVLGRITGTHEAVYWEEVEAALWQSDLGAPTATAILETLRSKGLALHADNVLAAAREEAAKHLPESGIDLTPSPEGPVVILMVGVNGTGKTTSSAKLAALLKSRGQSVLLCAADTFRAAAVEQLKAWGEASMSRSSAVPMDPIQQPSAMTRSPRRAASNPTSSSATPRDASTPRRTSCRNSPK